MRVELQVSSGEELWIRQFVPSGGLRAGSCAAARRISRALGLIVQTGYPNEVWM